MYVFFHQGPVVIGGQNNVFLLQNPTDMQKALQTSGGGDRQSHRNQGSADVESESREKKKRLVTTTLVSALFQVRLLSRLHISCTYEYVRVCHE